MSVGIRTPYFEITDSTPRELGIATTTSSSGSVTDDGLLTSSRWYAEFLMDGGVVWGGEPLISVSGNVLSWSWPIGGGGAGRILYGVY